MKTPFTLIKPDKNSETRFEPYFMITPEQFKQCIIDAHKSALGIGRCVQDEGQNQAEQYYKDTYERINVKDCYKCDTEKERSIKDFVEGGKYECLCGHLFTVKDPSKTIFMDSIDFPKRK